MAGCVRQLHRLAQVALPATLVLGACNGNPRPKGDQTECEPFGGGTGGGDTEGGETGEGPGDGECGVPSSSDQDCCPNNATDCSRWARNNAGECFHMGCVDDADCRFPHTLENARCAPILDDAGNRIQVDGVDVKSCVLPCTSNDDCEKLYRMRGTSCAGLTAETIPQNFCNRYVQPPG